MNVIAHNLLAINANRQFYITNKNKAKNTEKLSSGYRINRAADDAAGLSISEKMRRQIRGISQGIRNTEDGVSLCQVADGALAEVSAMLHRVTELSVQSANETYADEDRKAIQHEISQIMQEIDRIGDTTEFNGKKVFQGQDVQTMPIRTASGRIRNSMTCSYSVTDGDEGLYKINFGNNDVIIGNEHIAFSEIKNENGQAFDKDNIKAGKYTINANTLKTKIEFHVDDGDTLENIQDAFYGMNIKVKKNTIPSPFSLSNVSMTAGSDAENFLKNTSQNGTLHTITANGYGIHIDNYDTISWADMNVTGDNISGKTIHFNDPKSGISFDIACNEKATLSGLVNSINNGSLKISKESKMILSCRKSIYQGNNNWMSPLEFMDTTVYMDDNLLKRLGYTSEADKINANVHLTFGENLDVQGRQYDAILEGKDGAIVRIPYLKHDSWGKNFLDTNDYWWGTQYYGQDIYSAPINITMCKPAGSGKLYATEYRKMFGNLDLDFNVSMYKANMVIDNSDEIRLDSVLGYGKLPIRRPGDNICSTLALWIQSGSEAGEGMFLEIDGMNTNILGVADLDVSTVDGANHALKAVKGALEKISSNRSKIGAQQNRLEYTIANELNVLENTTSAESLIRDTDMAKEMVEFSKAMILENVGQAMMAQANKSNQDVLALLS